MSTIIGAFEAKTKFSGLLDQIAKTGEEFVVTRYGEPVAVIKSVKSIPKEGEVTEAAKAVKAWREYLKIHPLSLKGINIKKDLIDEGRR